MPIPTTRRTVLAGSVAAGLVPGRLHAAVPQAGPLPLPPLVAGPRERLSLDEGWRFHEGDIPFPPILDHEAAYAHAKAGNAEGAAAADYDDSGWTGVRLPHDWALGQPFDPKANIDQGFRRRGIGWYRRTFALDPGDRALQLELQFDGIATHSAVWINGTLAHRHFSGFTGFSIDLTPFALFGQDLNTIAIRVDANATEGWWYEGAGLYRHAWLVKRAPVHIATDGVHADPRHEGGTRWSVPITLMLDNAGTGTASVTAEAVLRDTGGRPVGRASATFEVLPGRDRPAELAIAVDDPALWSPDSPSLYHLDTRLTQGSTVIDGVRTTIGFRTLRFDADRGFLLNGEPLKIKGACAHQDHAGVGVAVPDSLWDYRLRRLKAMGANALRCAHNPPARELLDAADRLGVLVMDEHRELSASDGTLDRLAWLVRRDRNHPSVILWSLCNEESIQASAMGVAMIRRMKSVVRALDTSRPITAALNGAMFAEPNIADELDVVGFNYGQSHYDRYHRTYPGRPLLSSEDTSAFMTRGALRTDRASHVMADDDSEHAGWGQTSGKAWAAIAKRPWMAGGFVWTGFDYRGEPTPFEWPSVSSFFGAMDTCGFAKSGFHVRRALWNDAEPVLQLWPHWTFPGQEGTSIPLLTISNAERVVLRLNGRPVGEADVTDGVARFSLTYAPGKLEAIGYREGRPVSHCTLETTGPAVALRLTPDRERIGGDGRNAVPVTVKAVDAQGRAVPIANDAMAFTIRGGHILGVGNGDPNSHESDLPSPDGSQASRCLFNGLAQVVITAIPGHKQLVLRAQAPGLRPAMTSLDIRPGTLPAVPPVQGRQLLTEWREAPAAASRPALGQRWNAADMNSWAWLKPGSVEMSDPHARYVLFRLAFTPRQAVALHGGTIHFAALAGKAELWLDGQHAATKSDPLETPLAIPLSPGSGEHVIELLFDGGGERLPFGLAGTVSLAPAGS